MTYKTSQREKFERKIVKGRGIEKEKERERENKRKRMRKGEG